MSEGIDVPEIGLSVKVMMMMGLRKMKKWVLWEGRACRAGNKERKREGDTWKEKVNYCSVRVFLSPTF